MTSPEAEALYQWKMANPYTGSRLHCAGCGEPLTDGHFEVGDGARVHPGARLIDCLAAHGAKRERQARVELGVVLNAGTATEET